jgi:hypothetical protein
MNQTNQQPKTIKKTGNEDQNPNARSKNKKDLSDLRLERSNDLTRRIQFSA